MHRKTSTALERLAALRTLSISIATRTGVAAVQLLALALRLLRNPRQADISAVFAAFKRRPRLAAGLCFASILVVGLAVGAGILVRSDAPETPVVAVADAQDRLAAAERAGRSARDEAPAPAADTVAAAPAPPPAWVAPMVNIPLSSCYGQRWGAMHQGLDFAGESGTPILAVGAGTVFGAGWLYAGYGQSVVIDHGHGLFTHYAHASAINVVVGQQVNPADLIAWEGSSGNSTGPHLHFEVHQGLWNQINPAQFLRERGVQIGC
jgi:murein DD-endopeptidase MepM/ murein hydrolase activator NlpD